jgi:predicted small secreted protein
LAFLLRGFFFFHDGQYSQSPHPVALKQSQETVMKKVIAILLVAMYGVLMGCNTMEGLGRDVERGGEKMQGEAQDARK